MIKRYLAEEIQKALEPQKVLVIYGPRRVGKTTLLEQLFQNFSGPKKFVDGEDRSIQEILSSQRLDTLKKFVGDTELLIVDEAQKIPNIGLNLKLIVDHIPTIKVVASGSASFSLAQQIGEPLTGRKKTFHLYPLSLKELIDHYGFERHKELMTNDLMLFGGYPEIFRLSYEKRTLYLKEIVEAYLFRDILAMEEVRNPKKLRDLLTLLAFQIGKEVSLHELGTQLGLHADTVYRYLDLLEKSFILVNIRGFSRNLRKEVTKMSRYYFYDNGIRNALIGNFNPFNMRNDVGELWENSLVMERLKKQERDHVISNNYFWRTYDQQEIDWVEEREGKLFAFEFKWNPRKVSQKAPQGWQKAYPGSAFECITNEDYLDFV